VGEQLTGKLKGARMAKQGMTVHGADVGKLLVRLAVGGMMLLHGIGKIRSGVSGMGPMLEAKGIPGFVAYGSYVGEVLAPLLLIIGVFTRVAGPLVSFTMVMAIYLVHSADMLKLDPQSGGWLVELQMFYLVGGIAIAFLGAGTLSVSRGKGRLD
jgi:putative oxidoreductase